MKTAGYILKEARRLFIGLKEYEMFMLNAVRHFKRGGRIGPLTPYTIQIQTHSRCNGRCIYCPYTETSRTLPQGKMEWGTFEKIAREIIAWRDLRYVELMFQNEPLMDAGLFEKVRYIKSLKPTMRVGIVSNATLLSEACVHTMVKSGLDEITISLDAFTKETYEELHPGFSFDAILAAIDRVTSIGKDKIRVVISFVFTQRNAKEFPAFVKFVENRRLAWDTIYLVNRANSVKEYDNLRLTKRSWRYLKTHMMYKYVYKTCTLPFFMMGVLYTGDVVICCQDWNREIVIGNVKDASLLEIWDSNRYNELRRAIAARRFGEIKTCSACTIAELSR